MTTPRSSFVRLVRCSWYQHIKKKFRFIFKLAHAWVLGLESHQAWIGRMFQFVYISLATLAKAFLRRFLDLAEFTQRWLESQILMVQDRIFRF